MTDFNQDKMEVGAVLSEAVYRKSDSAKMKDVEKYYPDRFEYLDSDPNHLVVKDTQTGKIHLAIAGTDITGEKGNKLKDLGTDVLVTLGLHKLGNRYKKSDKILNALVKEHGKENIVLAAHSLGGTIASDLSHKYDVESHSFSRGGTHQTFSSNKYKVLHPAYRRRAKQNHVYLATPTTQGFDPLSLGTAMDPLANIHFTQPKKLAKKDQGIIAHHSIHHHTPDLKKVKRNNPKKK